MNLHNAKPSSVKINFLALFASASRMLHTPLLHQFIEESRLLLIERAILDALALVLCPIEESTALHPMFIRQMPMKSYAFTQLLIVPLPVFISLGCHQRLQYRWSSGERINQVIAVPSESEG